MTPRPPTTSLRSLALSKWYVRSATFPIRPNTDFSAQKLEGLNFDQSSDFDALKIGFQQLGRNLAAAVQEHGSVVQSEFEAAQAEVSALDKQLQE